MGFTFRFGKPEDAGRFAAWASDNPSISRRDIEAGMKENNPTSTVLVIEEDGEPLFFVPAYQVLRIAYLCFNPRIKRRKRMQALEAMLNALKGFAVFNDIREIDTLTKKEIPVAKWAQSHGFIPDDRELFTVKAIESERIN